MPPRKKADPAPELCAEHFPYGLDDQPGDATMVSCAHGSWDVAALKPAESETPSEPKYPAPPKDPAQP